MKKKGLTAMQIQHMKPDTVHRIEVPAGPPKGLYLVLHPTGRKGWALRYRYRDRPRNLTFKGTYPEMGLSAARGEAEAALARLAQDMDPAIVQTEETEKDEPNSAKAVADEWISRYVKPNTRTWPEVQRILNREVLPVWKDKYISEIERPDVLRLLDAIVDRGAPVLANRTLSILKRWFRWAVVDRGYLDISPVAGMRPPTAEESRDRVLSPEELAEIWNAAPDLGFPFGSWFRFVILTAQRRNEVARVQWDHIDPNAALWTLPREATKADRVHDVPLSGAALDLLSDMPRFDGPYVFTTTSGERPISGFSKAKVALDTAIRERRKKQGIKGDIENWTIHDLRRTAATWMAQNGIPPHVLGALLNHSPGTTAGVTSIYVRFRYTPERRAALEAWADFVLTLADAKPKKRRRAG